MGDIQYPKAIHPVRLRREVNRQPSREEVLWRWERGENDDAGFPVAVQQASMHVLPPCTIHM